MAKKKIPSRKYGKEATADAVWAAIALDYETGQDSLKALAAKHGVSYSSLQHRCAREDWVGKREAFREQTQDKIRRELQARYVKDMVKEYDRLEATEIQLVTQIVQGKTVKLVGKGDDGEPVILETKVPLDANSLDAASNALVNLVKAKAVFVGVPGDITRQEQTGAGGGPVKTAHEVTTDDILASPRATAAACDLIEALAAAQSTPDASGVCPDAE